MLYKSKDKQSRREIGGLVGDMNKEEHFDFLASQSRESIDNYYSMLNDEIEEEEGVAYALDGIGKRFRINPRVEIEEWGEPRTT